MERTTILLPADLKLMAEKTARKNGISLGELIRETLETTLMNAPLRRNKIHFLPMILFIPEQFQKIYP